MRVARFYVSMQTAECATVDAACHAPTTFLCKTWNPQLSGTGLILAASGLCFEEFSSDLGLPGAYACASAMRCNCRPPPKYPTMRTSMLNPGKTVPVQGLSNGRVVTGLIST